jgi:hypothetical protein
VGRADAGIRRLLKELADINFRSVARAAGVSLEFLYSQPELRTRIENLRRQQNPATPVRGAESSGDGSVIQTLAEPLRRERSTNREYVKELEQRLAATHEETLRPRRQAAEHGLPD